MVVVVDDVVDVVVVDVVCVVEAFVNARIGISKVVVAVVEELVCSVVVEGKTVVFMNSNDVLRANVVVVMFPKPTNT